MSAIENSFDKKELIEPSISRKRKILTLKSKVNIINRFENGEKICEISKRLSLPNSTVSSIVRDRKRILAASKHTSVLNSSTVIRKRHGIIAQMECQLKTWCEHQEQNTNITRKDICTQAKIIFETIKKNYGDAAKDVTFLASKGWYFRFKQRCEENRFTEPEEEIQDDETSATDVKKEKKEHKAITVDNTKVNSDSTFCSYLKSIIESGYSPQTVFNVDEIGLYWKRMPEKSYLAKSDQSNAFDESKDRLTVLLGGNAAGDLKLKPFVIYCLENPRALRNKCKGGLPVIWKSNSKANMTACLFEDWFGNYFIPEVERYCYANNIPCKVLLIIDRAIYHPPSTLLDFDHRVNVVFLPAREACSIQPMHQEILTIFKAIYTRRVFQHLKKAAKQNDIVTVEELWKQFNILDAIRIIVDSWTEIPINDWKITWNKLCPYFSLRDKSECNRIAAIIDIIVKLALELDIKIDNKDVCELLDSHRKELTIEELIEMQEYSTNEEKDNEDPLHDERTMTVDSLTEAFTHIKIGLQILENVDSNELRARTTRLGVMKLLGAYDEILNVKMKLMAQQDKTSNR